MPDIDTILADLSKRYEPELERVYREMTRKLEAYIVSLDIQDGKFVNTPANVARLANSQREIETIMLESGYSEAVDNYVSEYQGIITSLSDDYRARGISPVFTTVDQDSLRMATTFDIERFETIGSVGAETVRRELFNAVAGNGNAVTFIDSVRVNVPEYYKRWASTYATTAGANFSRLVEDKIQVTAGIESFEYWGPMDGNTREFCARLLMSGKSYTRDEIAAMDNGQTPMGTVKEMGGGWNCRHRWIPGEAK